MIYTEEMKIEIESHGMMVIEFKMMLKKRIAAITLIADKIALVFENIFGVIKEFSNKFAQLVKERIVPIFRPLEKLLRKSNTENKKRRFIRCINSGYRLIIKRPIMIHCRNNC